jgi:hypothetical protein
MKFQTEIGALRKACDYILALFFAQGIRGDRIVKFSSWVGTISITTARGILASVDLESTCEIDAAEFYVSLPKFRDGLKGIRGTHARVTVETLDSLDKVSIHCGAYAKTVKMEIPSGFNWSLFDAPIWEMKVDATFIRDLIAYNQFCEDEEARPSMSGVRLEEKDGVVNMVVTDGYSIAYSGAGACDRGFLVPHSVIDALDKFGPVGGAAIRVMQENATKNHDRIIEVKADGITLADRTYDKYPAWREFISSQFAHEVTIPSYSTSTVVDNGQCWIVTNDGYFEVWVDHMEPVVSLECGYPKNVFLVSCYLRYLSRAVEHCSGREFVKIGTNKNDINGPFLVSGNGRQVVVMPMELNRDKMPKNIARDYFQERGK